MPLFGAIWVPSTDRLNVGFGRKNAVISCALDSSIFNVSASSVGLFISNRSFTFSHVQSCECVCAAGAIGAACATAIPHELISTPVIANLSPNCCRRFLRIHHSLNLLFLLSHSNL